MEDEMTIDKAESAHYQQTMESIVDNSLIEKKWSKFVIIEEKLRLSWVELGHCGATSRGVELNRWPDPPGKSDRIRTDRRPTRLL